MSGSGIGGNPFAACGFVKAHEPKPGDAADVSAERGALDAEELRELEAELYGEGAGPAHEPEPVETHRVLGSRPHPRRAGR
jgi:hypothetical protein